MQQGFHTTKAGQTWHFRSYGDSGPCIVLLHASPGSSQMVAPLAGILASNCRIICPDTPGYGASEGLGQEELDMADYARALYEFLDSIGVEKTAIYGTATGAQLAIRFGLLYPERVHQLFLDNCAHFSNEMREKILLDYFPDLSSRYDGSHLAKLWTIVHDLFVFFPWCWREEKYRLNIPTPSPAFLHAFALYYLEAGANYHLAYKAAFIHEKASYVAALEVPSWIIRWPYSILKPYTEDLLNHDLGAAVNAFELEGAVTERYPRLAAFIEEQIKDNPTVVEIIDPELSEQPTTLINLDDYPDLSPDIAGSYLQQAWHFLRTKQLAEKAEVDLGSLDRELLAWMKQI